MAMLCARAGSKEETSSRKHVGLVRENLGVPSCESAFFPENPSVPIPNMSLFQQGPERRCIDPSHAMHTRSIAVETSVRIRLIRSPTRTEIYGFLRSGAKCLSISRCGDDCFIIPNPEDVRTPQKEGHPRSTISLDALTTPCREPRYRCATCYDSSLCSILTCRCTECRPWGKTELAAVTTAMADLISLVRSVSHSFQV